MRNSGRASRTFIMGIRLCPPLRIFAPSPYSFSRAMASETVSGRKYSKDWGIILLPLQASDKLTPRAAGNSDATGRSSHGLTCLGCVAGGSRSAGAQASGDWVMNKRNRVFGQADSIYIAAEPAISGQDTTGPVGQNAFRDYFCSSKSEPPTFHSTPHYEPEYHRCRLD
jgi:hypothetical protein